QNNTARQNELDAIMAFIRDAKQPGGLITLAPKTPILMIGDMNLVGYSRQLRTLLSGEIVDTLVYGPRFAPDWDESDLSDLLPRHPDRLLAYTWRNDLSSYPPGRLDYMIYTDNAIEPGNRFALFTGEMSDNTLAAYGLQRNDVTTASDHLPLVGDFIVPVATGVETRPNNDVLERFSLSQNYPNPFNPSTEIQFSLSRKSYVTLTIFDLLGREVATLISEELSAGSYSTHWDAAGLPSGVYLYRLQAGAFVETKKLILLW
ncbi:MAG: T9SS type A sorting domain-containing protein, partial [Ignavibacteriales bacterium]|nr:T9SS type A sorting domain-containing protein [Ignavibacteriales bacterium]